MAESRKALAGRGGRLIQVRLEPEIAEALAAFRHERDYKTDKEAVCAAIADARSVRDIIVRLTYDEAVTLARLRAVLGVDSDRDAVAWALTDAASRL
jgi:hypothetical protein